MAFDQTIRYNVAVDDSNFQAKLSQMRASMDASLGGMSAGGFSGNMMYGMMGVMGGGGYGMGGGMADFGSQIRPITYTPPAIAMQPHFGMYQVSQTLAQAGLGAMGPIGVGVSGAITNFRNGGIGGLINGPAAVPNNITMAEYMAMSARGLGDRVGDAVGMGVMTAGATGAGILAGGLGAAAGASLFTGAIMRGVGGLMGGMAGGMLVSAFTDQVTDMMADNRQMQSALAAGSFRFFTGSGAEVDRLTGRGMSRSARFNVAKSIQSMEQSDLRYGMDEYKQILEAGMQMDMFSGTRDVEDFKGKFKGLVESLKTVTATLHTSLKEGVEVIRGFRDMGVTDPSEVARLTMTSEMRGRMSGRTGMEMVAIGQAGAELFRGTGISMERGFELNQMNTTTVRGLLNQGLLSRESIAQAGGENSLAQQMTAGALSAFQTAQGRAAMMANFNPATGMMNPDMIGRLSSGGLMNQVAGAAAMGPAGLLTFQARQEELISQMSPQSMQMFGLSLDVGVARHLMQAAPGLKMEDAIRNAGQMRGLSKAQIDTELAMMRQDPEKMKSEQEAAVNQMAVQAGLEDRRNRFNPGKSLSNWWSRRKAPFAKLGGELGSAAGEMIEGIEIGLTGQQSVNSGVVNASMRDATIYAKETGGITDIDGSWYQRQFGQSGQGLIDRISQEGKLSGDGKSISFKGAEALVFGSKDEAKAYGLEHGVNLHVGTDASGRVIGYTTQAAGRMMKSARAWQATKEEAAAAEKVELDKELGGKILGLGADASLSQVMETMGYKSGLSDEAFQAAYGQSKGAVGALAKRYLGIYGYKKARDELERESSGRAISDALDTGAGQDSRAAQAATNKLSMLVMDAAGGASLEEKERLRGALGAHPEIAAIIAGDRLSIGEKDQKIRELANGLDLRDVIKNFQATPETSKLVSEIGTANLRAQQISEAKGVPAGAGTPVLGDISKETVQIIEAQSAQLLANYQQLIALQERLNSLRGKQ